MISFIMEVVVLLLLLSHLSICQFKLLNLHYRAANFFYRKLVFWFSFRCYMVGVVIHLFGQSTMAFYGWIFHRLTCQRKLLITWTRWVQEYQMWSLGILQYNTKQRFGYPHDEDHQMYQMMKITKHQPCSLK